MTQDVQPLTWQKRTNIEEHQQFFSKINEIIGNLAPTVDEAEQAIAQATAAIASANDAVATANAASAAASAAASVVAGYDGRLTAAEGDIAAIEGREPDYLKKTGEAQAVTSQIMVPTAATGARDTQIANGTRIQNDLDAYVPMVRDTGNKTIAGNKTFTDNATMGATRVDVTSANKWKRIFTTPKRFGGIVRTWVFAYAGSGISNAHAALLQMNVSGSSDVPTLTWLVKGSAVSADSVAATVYDGVLNIWTSKSCALSCIGYSTRANLEGAQLTAVDETDEYDEPLSDDGFAAKYGAVVG